MTKHERELWQHLEAAHAGDSSPEELERWIAETPELESLIGSTLYLELISLDFHGAHPARDLYSLIERIYEAHRPSALAYDRAHRIATEFLEGTRDLWETASLLSWLSLTGHESWIPMECHAISAGLSEIPAPKQRHLWQPTALNHLLIENEPYIHECEQRLRAAAEQIVRTVNSQHDSL